MSDQIFDCKQGVGTCLACGKNFECGAAKMNYNAYFGKYARSYEMPKQEVYHSSTLGPIPLSFTGRRLMQNLREAFQELLQKRERAMNDGLCTSPDDWIPVSEARGKLAKYMSDLESKNVPQSLLDELARLRAFEAAVRPHLPPKIEYTPPLSFGRLNQVFGRAPRPMKNEYLVRVVEKPGKPPLRKTNGIIVTEIQVAGSMQVTAVSMDDALDTAVRTAHEHGFTELTKSDFEVRLLSVPEA